MNGSMHLAAAPPPVARLSDVGAALEEIRQGLMACCKELDGDSRAADASRALNVLQQLSCKVAVIGQVKAGKSCFISALIGRPNLLPSDANPWTTVVTSLHFQNRTPPAESAYFTFFNSDEWHRIAQGGGPLRELTERLVPGFDPGLLGAQLDAMRRRAEQRLGPSFRSLLGQSHTYSKIDRDVLGRYVSAGSNDMDVSTGWYSDITKSADLYFGSERRGLPIVIVDTPGTNDPLLVRDEITRLNVSSGELFVVMLTAQQPLTSADLALLRLLRGLRKDQLIVFLNRIDGVADIAQHVDRLVAHVEERLSSEFPDSRFPIVVGSAMWASIALAGSDAEVEAALGPDARALAERLGIAVPTAGGPGAIPAARAALLALSGLPSVTKAIDRLMQRGAAAHELTRQARHLYYLARSLEETEGGHVRALQRALGQGRSSAEARSGQLRAWKQELEQLEAASRQLQQNLEFYENSLKAIVARCEADLNQLLAGCLTQFVEQELDNLRRNYQERQAQTWRCDPTRLRTTLQQEFLRIYGYWEGMLQQVDSQIMAQLRTIMPSFTLGGQAGPVEAQPNRLMQQPQVTPLGRTLAFDLSVPWWRSWWSSRPALEDISARLERLLRSEFEPLIGDLIGAAISTMDERSQQAGRQARLCTLDIVDGIHKRSQELVAVVQRGDDGRVLASLRQIEQDLPASESRLARWSDLRGRLSALAAKCNIVLEGQGVA
jgi:GTP-binding protein EngB required for normal cell division